MMEEAQLALKAGYLALPDQCRSRGEGDDKGFVVLKRRKYELGPGGFCDVN